MEPNETDEQWMRLALEQAEQSVGLASPNPAVGCVVVQDGRVVGQGFHEYDRLDHAEVVALRQAGSLAKGATAYVTLEPCSHTGRTGPCADALLAAGVARVVVATADPNPLVQGRGIARLRAQGVAVIEGVLQEPARALNDSFARFIYKSLPFVTMKVALTLDGRIAPAQQVPGETFWITGDLARAEVHRMRHAADAVIAGVGTVLADDPLLTDRSGLRRRRPLLRIVLDSRLRTPLDAKLILTAPEDVLIVFSDADVEKQSALEARGVRLMQVPDAAGSQRIPLPELLLRLGRMQILNLMVEGGAEVYSSALAANIVDRLVMFYAPRFLGPAAVPVLGAITGVPPIQRYALKQFGQDFAVDALLRDPWSAGIEPA
jgi:diaminohydroxyphosphoribosylaminopyrimidine deaminase / 5-amino-6-(5-phosphoribosylamino)uracil reductase